MSNTKQTWVKVTSPSQLKIGDRVRYARVSSPYTYGEWWFGKDENDKRFVSSIDDNNVIARTCDGKLGSSLFKDKWDILEVLKTIEEKPTPIKKNKVLEAKIKWVGGELYTFSINFNIGIPVNINGDTYYLSRSSAIRAAKKFCKSIGFECKIV